MNYAFYANNLLLDLYKCINKISIRASEGKKLQIANILDNFELALKLLFTF